MIAEQLISDLIPPLKASDTGTKALQWMQQFDVNHLPIVNNQQLVGVISEEDILDLNEPDQPLTNHKLSLVRAYVQGRQHIYEVLKIASEMKLTLIPVVDDEDKYLGCITLDTLISYFASINAVKDPGGILVLDLNINDYTLTEIARIVESNNARILSLYVDGQHDSTKIEVTIKINKSDLQNIIATFERFNYNIKASYQETDNTDDLKERWQSFMNYLDI